MNPFLPLIRYRFQHLPGKQFQEFLLVPNREKINHNRPV